MTFIFGKMLLLHLDSSWVRGRGNAVVIHNTLDRFCATMIECGRLSCPQRIGMGLFRL